LAILPRVAHQNALLHNSPSARQFQ
jgi:hypothetical protein